MQTWEANWEADVDKHMWGNTKFANGFFKIILGSERLLSVSPRASPDDSLRVRRLEPRMATDIRTTPGQAPTSTHRTENSRTVPRVDRSVEQPPSDPTSARWGPTIQRAQALTDKTGYPLRSGATLSKNFPSNAAPTS